PRAVGFLPRPFQRELRAVLRALLAAALAGAAARLLDPRHGPARRRGLLRLRPQHDRLRLARRPSDRARSGAQRRAQERRGRQPSRRGGGTGRLRLGPAGRRDRLPVPLRRLLRAELALADRADRGRTARRGALGQHPERHRQHRRHHRTGGDGTDRRSHRLVQRGVSSRRAGVAARRRRLGPDPGPRRSRPLGCRGRSAGMSSAPQKLRFVDTALYGLALGTGMRWIAVAAAAAELTSRFDGEGGIYVWSRDTLGPLAGFLCGWFYWIAQLPYFAGILYFLGGLFLAAIGGDPKDTLAYLAISVAILGAVTATQLLGLRYGKWLPNFGTAGGWTVLLVIVGVGVL